MNRPHWVDPSKRGGMDGVFQGLAGLLRGMDGLFMLCHWYFLKNTILFNDISIGLEDINLYNINRVLQLHRSHACVEAIISMKLSNV